MNKCLIAKCQHVQKLINDSQMKCGLSPLLLQRNHPTNTLLYSKRIKISFAKR